MSEAEVTFEAVDIIFGSKPDQALNLLDQGVGRNEILEKTGQVVGVAGANLVVERGEICVLMGLSGSGKSTLLRSVNGLNKVTRGRTLVHDDREQVDVSRCKPSTLRHLRTRRIAMVFQQFALLPWRTVRDNVGFGLEIRRMKRDQRERVIDKMLKTVGLAGWSDKYAHELSGGMQQRVGLARAFATDADILLMDEPFSALDPLIRARLQDELLELQTKLQKTIIFVSHDLDEAMKIGSHIAIMEDGRIVQNGVPEAIVLNPVNDYVADFVAHMNPLNVLRAVSVMTPLADMVRKDEDILLDPAGRVRLTLVDGALSQRALVGGRSARIVDWTPDDGIEARLKGQIVTAPSTITLRTALELRHRTGHPVLLVNDGRMIGVIGDDEIHQGILRQSSIEPS